jgi:hypothetical protein
MRRLKRTCRSKRVYLAHIATAVAGDVCKELRSLDEEGKIIWSVDMKGRVVFSRKEKAS